MRHDPIVIITHSLMKGELNGREELQMADNKGNAASASSSPILLSLAVHLSCRPRGCVDGLIYGSIPLSPL
jgi:hypothetical protein